MADNRYYFIILCICIVCVSAQVVRVTATVMVDGVFGLELSLRPVLIIEGVSATVLLRQVVMDHLAVIHVSIVFPLSQFCNMILN